MIKKLMTLIIIILCSGCWNYQELNEYAIVTGMALDYKNNEYQLSFLISNGNKSENDQTKISVLTGSGITIYDAIKDVSLMSPKELYISHLSIVIVSEEVAKNGIADLIDFLMRDPQSHQNFYMVLAKNDKAQDMLSILSPLADYPSQNITLNVKNSAKLQGKITDANFNLFIHKLLAKGFEPIMNSLIIVGNEEEGQTPESQEKAKQDAYTKLDNIGIFKNDKLVGWATKEESIGISMLLGNISTVYFNIPCYNEYAVTVSNDYKIDYDVSKDKIIVNVNAEGSLEEISCNINLEDKNEINKLEKKVEEEMKKYMEDAIELAKNYQTDIFGFGNLIYKKYPKFYNEIEDWNTYFTNFNIEINTSFKYTSRGTLDQSLKQEIYE